MRCRAASIGALVQVLGLSLGAVSGSGLAVLSGLVAGLAAGVYAGETPTAGTRDGLAGSAMGLAGLGTSVVALTLFGGGAPVTVPAVVAAGAVLTSLGGAAVGGALGAGLSERVDPSGEPEIDSA